MATNQSDDSINKKSNIRVLVTGASGYVALHCVQQLINVGYNVRGTVRSLQNSSKVEPLRRLKYAAERLELVEADLVKNTEIWPNVIRGCQYVLHVASPWPVVADESTIDIAVNGTLTVLKAATKSGGVKKVVLTSSCAAINDGHRNDEKVFDENCWTDLSGNTSEIEGKQRLNKRKKPPVDNYAKSKTLAEQATWKYWNSLDKESRYDLTVLNPTFITGPVLSSVEHGSALIVGRMLDFRTFLAAPKACLGVVDVRDVSKAHVLSMEDESGSTNGQRILITHSRPVWFAQMIAWIGKEFKKQGFITTPLVAPNWMVRAYARTGWDEMSSAIIHRLGPELRFCNKKSIELLGMEYIDPRQSILDMIYSMLSSGMIQSPSRKPTNLIKLIYKMNFLSDNTKQNNAL